MNIAITAQRVHIEFSRVQTWLFAVPRLRAMVGANALLGETLRVALPDVLCQREAVAVGQHHVEHDDVGPELLEGCQYLLPVGY